MKARIIIGANLGDEGKGTITARYTKQAKGPVLNVLTNGGAQRAHSILTENGSFTFQHFGSGTYHGADNYFSEYFILNPMQFVKEYNELRNRGVKIGKIYRDPKCMWSTPWDMMANQIIEEMRGKAKHGSCGMGIWETVKRYRRQVCISFDDFLTFEDMDKLTYLNSIKNYYERRRVIPDHWKEIWNSDGLKDHFIADCKIMESATTTLLLPEQYNEVIFENGQGLMLCDTGINTPGTTPSYTDSRDAIDLINKKFKTDDVSVHYVTRSYMTRHGNGYLEKECNHKYISSDIQEDRTNHFNEHQGEFRYGILNISDLKNRIYDDNHGYERIIEVTHCDEMDQEEQFRKTFSNVNFYGTAQV